jgi:predicted transcriptional regulator
MLSATEEGGAVATYRNGVNGSAAKAGGPNGHQQPEAEPHSKKRFYPIHWSMDDWALSLYEARVLLHILRRASREGFAWASERTMAEDLGLERVTIRKHIHVLEQKCVLVTETRKLPGRRRQNVYKVRHPQDWKGVYKPKSEGEAYWIKTRANADLKMFRLQPQAEVMSTPQTEIGRANGYPNVGSTVIPTSGQPLAQRGGTSGQPLAHKVPIRDKSTKESASSSIKAAAAASTPTFASAQEEGSFTATTAITSTAAKSEDPFCRNQSAERHSPPEPERTPDVAAGNLGTHISGPISGSHCGAVGRNGSGKKATGPNKPKNWAAFAAHCLNSNWGWQYDEECENWARDFYRKMELSKHEKKWQVARWRLRRTGLITGSATRAAH